MTILAEAQRGVCVCLVCLSRLRWKLFTCLWLVSALSACASGPASAVVPQARRTARLPHHVFETTPNGMRIASLPRATPDVLWLALYIDAGSRDAALPETATLSAWLATDYGGAETRAAVRAVVFPDVTELSLPCTAERLDQCVGRLAQALNARALDADELARARERLRDAQRRALATQPHNPLERLALHALLPDTADGFFPLGRVDSDLVVATDAVPDFLRAHYGPERSLLVAAGDIGPHQLMDAASSAFRGTPRALQDRSARGLSGGSATSAAEHTPELAVVFDDQAGISIALSAPEERTLADVTRKLSSSLNEPSSKVSVSGHIFTVRGGALGLLNLEAADLQGALLRAGRVLSRMQYEPWAQRPALPQPDDLRASARALGLTFGSEGELNTSGLRFGAALALPAGSDAGPRALPERAAREQERSARVQELWQSTLDQASPELHGDLDQYVAAVTLDNGARIDVQYTQAESVAIAIRVGSGAAADPPSIHGKAALIATLTTMHCAGMGPELLQGRLDQLGATLTARVDAESYGVLLRVPKDNFEAATELALRCMRSPSQDPAHLVEASIRLQQRLRADDQDLAMRAVTADVLSPRAPGPFAPWGHPSRVPNLQPNELAQTLAQNQVGGRWSVGVVGPVEVERTTHWLARRLSDLGSGKQPESPHWDEPSTVLPSEPPLSRDGSGASMLAIWSARGDFSDALGAQLYARALRAMLGALPGVDVIWHDAGAYKQTSYAAVALHVRPDLIDSAPSWLRQTALSIDESWLDDALEPAVADAARIRNAAQAESAVRAEQIARLRLGALLSQPSVESARKQLLALRAAQPGFAAVP